MYCICKFWEDNYLWRFGVFCLLVWMDFCFGVGVGFCKMTVKLTLQTIPVACVNLMTLLDILSLIGFLRRSPVFPELFPDCKSCLSGEIQVLRHKLWILFCFGDMSLWSPQATPFLKVCHRAKCLSWGCTDVDHIGWLKTLLLRWRQVRIYCCILLCPLALIPIMKGNYGLVGSTSPKSMYIFQPLAVWSRSWPLLLYKISMICGAKIGNIHVMSEGVRDLSYAADAGRFNFWVVASLASGQKGPRGSDLWEHLFPCCKECLKWQWLFF